MDEYVYVSVCVRGWVAKEGILSSASLTCIIMFGRFAYFDMCPRERARPEEKTKNVGC